MNMVRRLLWVLRNTGANLWRARLAAAAAVASTTLALTLATTAVLLGMQLSRLENHWTGNVDVTVYLCTRMSVTASCDGAADGATIETVRAALENLPGIAETRFEDRAAAEKAFAERFKNTGIPELLGKDALPESFRVRLSPDADRRETVAAIDAALNGVPGVETVQDQRRILSGFFTLARRVRTGAGALAALQAVTSIALLAHLVRSSVTKRGREIRVMSLVGTPARTIRAPFVLESAALGLLAAGISSAIVVALTALARQSTTEGAALLLAPANVVSVCAATAAATAAISWTVARLSLRRALPREN